MYFFLLTKDHGKHYLLCLLMYILKFALTKQSIISELRVRLAHSETGLSPLVKYFYWRFQGGTSFVDHLYYLCHVF